MLLSGRRLTGVGTAKVFRLPELSTPSARAGVALVMPVNCAVDAVTVPAVMMFPVLSMENKIGVVPEAVRNFNLPDESVEIFHGRYPPEGAPKERVPAVVELPTATFWAVMLYEPKSVFELLPVYLT